jgi:hypothetical protein
MEARVNKKIGDIRDSATSNIGDIGHRRRTPRRLGNIGERQPRRLEGSAAREVGNEGHRRMVDSAAWGHRQLDGSASNELGDLAAWRSRVTGSSVTRSATLETRRVYGSARDGLGSIGES